MVDLYYFLKRSYLENFIKGTYFKNIFKDEQQLR